MSMSNLDSDALARLNDPKWRVRNSWWQWVVWMTAGLFGAFIYVWMAFVVRQRKFIIAAIVSSVIFVAYFYVSNQVPRLTGDELAAAEGTTRVATPMENVMMALIALIVTFNVWMSFYLKKPWLISQASSKQSKSWVEANLNIKTTSIDNTKVEASEGSSVDLVAAVHKDAEEFLAPPAKQNSAKNENDKAVTTVAIDVNTATRDAFIALPGMSEALVDRLISERESTGGFQSFGEMSVALSLKPHEAAKLEPWCEFSPPKRTPSSGRILDI